MIRVNVDDFKKPINPHLALTVSGKKKRNATDGRIKRGEGVRYERE